jgi:hypothetical protein
MGSSSNAMGCCLAVYLNKKRKIGYEKYSQNNNNHNKSGKVDERHWVNSNG